MPEPRLLYKAHPLCEDEWENFPRDQKTVKAASVCATRGYGVQMNNYPHGVGISNWQNTVTTHSRQAKSLGHPAMANIKPLYMYSHKPGYIWLMPAKINPHWNWTRKQKLKPHEKRIHYKGTTNSGLAWPRTPGSGTIPKSLQFYLSLKAIY